MASRELADGVVNGASALPPRDLFGGILRGVVDLVRGIERHEVRRRAPVTVDQEVARDAVEQRIKPAACDPPPSDMNERSDGGVLCEIGGLFGRASPRSEHATQAIERLRVRVIKFDGKIRFEIPSLDGQGRLTPKLTGAPEPPSSRPAGLPHWA